MKKKCLRSFWAVLLALLLALLPVSPFNANLPVYAAGSFNLSEVPAWSGSPYTAVNNNVPYFSAGDLTTAAFERYSDLDSLGRCGTAYANVCREIMPTEKRGAIGSIKPTGWHTVKYAGIDGNYLYNRCHLIGYQLSGENANEKNLITGTRYLNVVGMLPFENMVADYVKETNHHVLYRVTPVFEGSNLLASGVLIEAKSVEDNGEGVQFCVYCYNVQPGITINYKDGSSTGPAYRGSNSDGDSESLKTEEMYRLYNPNSGEHFYTASTGERNQLTRAGWRYEGIGWTAPASGTPVYRLYNANAGDHHYTKNAGERNNLIRAGWKDEGIGWYSGGSVALYRQYNPNARAGSHNYTTSLSENNYLVRLGWRAEGIGWYGLSKEEQASPSSTNTLSPTPSSEPTVTPTIVPTVTPTPAPTQMPSEGSYIGNRNTRKFHHSWCSAVKRMSDENKVELGSRQAYIDAGYSPCKICNP